MCEEVSVPDQEIPNLKEHAKYYGVKVYDQNCAELGYFHKIGGTYTKILFSFFIVMQTVYLSSSIS